jgi:4-alpha-glucanotransferase
MNLEEGGQDLVARTRSRGDQAPERITQNGEHFSGLGDPALFRLAWSSAAALAIVPLQDALNLGKDARMDQPGRAEGATCAGATPKT